MTKKIPPRAERFALATVRNPAREEKSHGIAARCEGSWSETIAGDPREDIWPTSDTDHFAYCPGGTILDADTDECGQTDLADVGLFAQDYYGGYHYRSDLVWDQQLNIADVGRFAIYLGVQCP